MSNCQLVEACCIELFGLTKERVDLVFGEEISVFLVLWSFDHAKRTNVLFFLFGDLHFEMK